VSRDEDLTRALEVADYLIPWESGSSLSAGFYSYSQRIHSQIRMAAIRRGRRPAALPTAALAPRSGR
jgi:hypothetical protein